MLFRSLIEKQDAAHASIKETEAKIIELSLIQKHAATYRQLRPVYDRYRQSWDKEKFLRGHESDIILFEAAARELKRMGAVPLPSLDRAQTELAKLIAQKNILYAEYSEVKHQIQEYETIRQNLNILLPDRREQAQWKVHIR